MATTIEQFLAAITSWDISNIEPHVETYTVNWEHSEQRLKWHQLNSTQRSSLNRVKETWGPSGQLFEINYWQDWLDADSVDSTPERVKSYANGTIADNSVWELHIEGQLTDGTNFRAWAMTGFDESVGVVEVENETNLYETYRPI